MGRAVCINVQQFKPWGKSESNLLKQFCSGYFAYDTVYTIKYRKFNFASAFYCYHHLASIYYLHQNPVLYMADKVIFWGELSNLPSYFVYYYLKTNKDPKMLKWLIRLQFCMYSFIHFIYHNFPLSTTTVIFVIFCYFWVLYIVSEEG